MIRRCALPWLIALWSCIACAQPLTVRGNIKYSESESRLTPRALSGAEIELWSCKNWLGAMCGWSRLAGGKTDDSGNYTWTVSSPRDVRDLYQVRVHARNNAAIVWQQDTGTSFWSDIRPQAVAANPGSNLLVINRLFGNTGSDLFASRHFNAAQKLLAARDFALHFRDGTETDTLGRVIVAPALINTLGTTFTNAAIVHLDPAGMFEEARVLVHEYGHFVQESIGTYHMWPARHNGCTAFVLDPNALINSPEYAWFEGFASFYSSAVRLYSADGYAEQATPMTVSTYSASPCNAIGKMGPAGIIGPDAIERRVHEFLFLMMNDDGSACGVPSTSSTYRTCAAPIWEKNLKLILSIADKELDADRPGPADMNKFARAWLDRGGSRAKLNAAMLAVGVTPPPIPQPPDPHDLCLAGCDEQHAACMLSAHTGLERQRCIRERRECRDECQR